MKIEMYHKKSTGMQRANFTKACTDGFARHYHMLFPTHHYFT